MFLPEMEASGKYVVVDDATNTPPTQVKVVPCFKRDIQALLSLTESATPPLRLVRMDIICYVFY